MTNVAVNTNAPQKISAKDIHTKWDKISEQEASSMKATGDIVTLVQAKYSLNKDQAQKDVDSWANGRGF